MPNINHSSDSTTREPALQSRRKLRNYTRENLLLAVEEVMKAKLSVRGAAKKYGVPHTTLRDRLGHEDPMMEVWFGAAPTLTAEEENELERWLIDKAEHGKPYRVSDLKLAAKRILDQDPTRENCFKGKNNLPTKSWLRGFLKRHPKIHSVKGFLQPWPAPEEAQSAAEGDVDHVGVNPQRGCEYLRKGALKRTASISERENALAVLESLMMRRTLLTYQKLNGLGITSLPMDELYNIWRELKETSQPLPRPPQQPDPEDPEQGGGGVQPTGVIGRMVAKRMRNTHLRAKRLKEAERNRKAFYAKLAQKRGRSVKRGKRAATRRAGERKKQVTGEVVVIVQESRGVGKPWVAPDEGSVLVETDRGLEVAPDIRGIVAPDAGTMDQADGEIHSNLGAREVTVDQRSSEGTASTDQELGDVVIGQCARDTTIDRRSLGRAADADEAPGNVVTAPATCGSCRMNLTNGDLVQVPSTGGNCERCQAVIGINNSSLVPSQIVIVGGVGGDV